MSPPHEFIIDLFPSLELTQRHSLPDITRMNTGNIQCSMFMFMFTQIIAVSNKLTKRTIFAVRCSCYCVSSCDPSTLCAIHIGVTRRLGGGDRPISESAAQLQRPTNCIHSNRTMASVTGSLKLKCSIFLATVD